jgi:hypothetical protein
MSRTVGFVDAAFILNNAYFLRISAWVNYHNLFSLLGWLWLRALPFGTEFFKVNLLSSLFGAATVYLVFLTCLRLTKNLPAALMAAGALMLSHSLWWHSTMLEVYTLNTLLIAAILYSVLRYTQSLRSWGLFAAAFFWGLGISNHILMALFAPASIALLFIERKRLRFTHLLIAAGCLAAGLALFIFAVLKSFQNYRSLAELFADLTGGEYRFLMFRSDSHLFWWLNYLILLAYQYPSAAFFFLFCGIAALVRKPAKFDYFLLFALAPQLIWSANYYVWDMYAFSLPAYVLLSLMVCKGLSAFRLRQAAGITVAVSLLVPLLLYPNAHRLWPFRALVDRYPMVERTRDSYDPLEYYLNPCKLGYDAVDRHVRELFEKLPYQAVYYDINYDYPIGYYYQSIRGLRPDLLCPIHFRSWFPEEEIPQILAEIKSHPRTGREVNFSEIMRDTLASRILTQIKSHLHTGREVYLSGFMRDILFPRLGEFKLVEIAVSGGTIFRILPGL